MTTKGFHVCKPGNAPTVGQVKSFIIAGDRIRSKAADQGGQNYTITAVTQNATYKDSYGNVGYDIEVEPSSSGRVSGGHTEHGGNAQSGRAAAGMSKDDYWTRKEERDIEASQRMNRSHAQDMALRYFAMIGGFGDKSATEALRGMTDWFQRDSWRTAGPKQESGDVF
jgi:hypothetical protein